MQNYEGLGNSTTPPIESSDDSALSQLAPGASILFEDATKIILPSGRLISKEEAQVFASLFSPDVAESNKE
jgi:hypothetical protein